MEAIAIDAPKMMTGYAYEFHGFQWRMAKSDRWDTVVHTANDADQFVGTRYIDGCLCNVWQSAIGCFHAQTKYS